MVYALKGRIHSFKVLITGSATPSLISDLEKIIKGTPDFIVPIQYDKILSVRTSGPRIDENIRGLQTLPTMAGGYIAYFDDDDLKK